MKLAESLSDVRLLFLDSAPVIYFVERHPMFAPVVDYVFNRLDSGDLRAVTSPVTLAECLVVPIRSAQESIQVAFRQRILAGRGVSFQPITQTEAIHAAEFRARHKFALTDALQIAAAIASGCDAMLTNDAALRRASELNVLLVSELEP